MKFITRKGMEIEFDPFDQSSIDAAKAQAPGEGIGPAVGDALANEIAAGEITHLSQIPEEYKKLGQAIGLPD